MSQDASLLGVSAKWIAFDPNPNDVMAAADTNLIGMGDEGALIQYDPATAAEESIVNTQEILNILLKRGGHREPIGAPESVGPSSVDRVSATEKGSLLIWSNVELR